MSANKALEGRMPILPEERIFHSFRPFLWSCTTLGSAVWVFLIGAGLAGIGDIRVTIPGYIVGLILGFVPPVVSSGLPSFRYGIDPMDATKATFGSRGTFIPVLGLLYVICAWEAVVTAFIAKGGATILALQGSSRYSSIVEITLAMLVVLVSWTIVRRGPQSLERVNNVVGPGLLFLSAALLILLAIRVGPKGLWIGAAPVTGRMTNDTHLAFISALELGIGASFGNWPFMGGLLRLVRNRRHVVTPSMLGLTIIGLGFGAAVAAMIAVALPSADPLVWILSLGGPIFGNLIIAAMLIGNIAIVGLLSYFGAVALQQVQVIARLRWDLVVAMTLIPAMIAAFNVDTTLSSVLSIANYQGMCIVGIAAVCFSDYFILRRQRLDIAQLYVVGSRSRYWFWGGLNWIAVGSVVVTAAIYRLLYDPATLTSAPAFRLFGASIPAFVIGAAIYAGVSKLVLAVADVGGYRTSDASEVAIVSL